MFAGCLFDVTRVFYVGIQQIVSSALGTILILGCSFKCLHSPRAGSGICCLHLTDGLTYRRAKSWARSCAYRCRGARAGIEFKQRLTAALRGNTQGLDVEVQIWERGEFSEQSSSGAGGKGSGEEDFSRKTPPRLVSRRRRKKLSRVTLRAVSKHL